MGAMIIGSGMAQAQDKAPIDIPSQSLASALYEYGSKTGRQVMFTPDVVTPSKTSSAVSAAVDEEAALRQLLQGTGLTFTRRGNVFVIQPEGGSGPQDESAGDVDALIVTAQKREENIQDVPIAISAFSQKSLEEQKIEGGFDLLKAIPNVTFSKNNFTGYNFSIRGVGTKAISATTDPGVAVAFNNTTLIHNRLFEQEYLDMERVEVLRGPQGTLYGRNATSGVINVLTKRPDFGAFEGSVKGEVGNYNTKRLTAIANVPVIEDVLALRFAGSLTSRDGYDYNSITRNDMNGRDLWTGRISARYEPVENLRANFVWERFEEDDNRSRTGKQLCHRDDGPTHVGSVRLADGVNQYTNAEVRRALFSQGCKPGNLYDDAAFGTPNGLSYSFILGTIALKDAGTTIGKLPGGPWEAILKPIDPYGGVTQSNNLREIASLRDPVYRAGADLFELNVEYDVSDYMSVTSPTVFNRDKTYSFQDYNRFNSIPIFTDTSNLIRVVGSDPSGFANLAPGGVFCDPQIGCSKTIAGFDISKAESEQFSQEFRLQSSFEGPLNFSVGANYTEFETLVDYYVMFNLLTAMAWSAPFSPMPEVGRFWEPDICAAIAYGAAITSGVSSDDPLAGCPYVDPNPVESINGEGHNYFRSKNPYSLKSTAAFGEVYWNIRDDLKLTAGLRYTDDRKAFIPVPSQALTERGLISGGLTSKGYPEDPPIKQKWGEFTGRLGLDWKPNLGFTDETLIYAFYSRGYKGGRGKSAEAQVRHRRGNCSGYD